MSNNELVKKFDGFIEEDILNEFFNKLPVGKVKKITINMPRGKEFDSYWRRYVFVDVSIDAYAGYNEKGAYLIFDDDGWKVLKSYKISKVLSINDKNKIIQFELEDDRLMNCKYSIKIFTFDRALKNKMEDGYVFYIEKM